MQRYVWVCVLALAGVVGCDSDEGPGSDGDAGPMGLDGSAAGGTGGVGGTGATGGDPGTGGVGGAGEDAGADDGGVEPNVDGGGGAGGGTGGLPVDGSRLAVCYSNADCEGGLECSLYGDNAGYCVETCADAMDCEDVDGIEASCGTTGVCRIDCGEDGSDGMCPDGMECAEIETGLFPLITITYRCQYPAGSGAKDQDQYGQCDLARGDADCMADLTCQAVTNLCIATCMDENDCADPGTGATPVCDKALLATEGTCGLTCADDKDCPGDLLCEGGLTGILTGMRCIAP